MPLTLVTPENHAQKSWSAPPDYRFVRMAAVVSVVASEVGKASSALPLVFSKMASGWDMVAVLGRPGQPNWLVGADGRWLGRYTPAALRAFPFRLAPVGEPPKLMLCVEEGSGLVLEEGKGVPFFDADGQPGTKLAEMGKFLSGIEQSRRATVLAVQALDAARVLVPFAWGRQANGEPTEAGLDLWSVDEKALNALDANTLAGLRQHGALGLAYAQMLSVHHTDTLRHLQRLQAAQQGPASGEQAAEAVVAPGLTNDGVLKFS